MKLTGFEVTFSGTNEEWRAVQAWGSLSPAQQAGLTGEAWTRWIMASCAERNGGHAWWLEWDCDNGLHLHCRHCPAGVDELYPDGMDVLFAELPLPGGGILVIESGSAALDTPAREWHGAVRVRVEQEYYRGGAWGGPEWVAWVVAEAAS
jgi:hypothetical protein